MSLSLTPSGNGSIPCAGGSGLLEAVRRLLLREARQQPVLLVFEDLHWIDGETQVLLDGLVESLPTTRVLPACELPARVPTRLGR